MIRSSSPLTMLLSRHTRRREFITLLVGAAAWPLAARAQQQGRIPRIGIIDDTPMWDAFRQGLRDLGYLEGQNIAFEYRRADGAPERLAEAATDLARRPVDVIATFGTAPSIAAKAATTTIPILMIAVGDVVRTGEQTCLSSYAGGALMYVAGALRDKGNFCCDVGDGSCSICGMLIFGPHKSDGMPTSSSPCA